MTDFGQDKAIERVAREADDGPKTASVILGLVNMDELVLEDRRCNDKVYRAEWEDKRVENGKEV